jgi:APA family basic amino acid/polyamine antiporter
VTALLVYGIRESARTNTTIVIIKIAVVMFVIAFGAFLVRPPNLCATKLGAALTPV